ncbi:MAG: esterase family protein [Acidimicrobiales bacterium]
MRRNHVELWSPAIGGSGAVVAYGHWGRPVLVFPAEGGRPWEFEERGMLSEVAGLVDAGRVKLYCVDSFDSASWSNRSIPVEDRARRHEGYESWILDQVVPFIADDCGGWHNVGEAGIVTTGVSMGAYHAVNLALKHADRFPLAIGLSGNYDPTTLDAWGERGMAAYFNTPLAYVSHLHGGHLEWLRSRLRLVLVCGQGMWEDSTGALESTRQLAGLLTSKGIPHELDLWGHDIPHDWPSWRRMIAHHLPRIC